MTWRWVPFFFFCGLLLFTGWLAGFLMSRWLAVIAGGMIGLIAGLQCWFENAERHPRRF